MGTVNDIEESDEADRDRRGIGIFRVMLIGFPVGLAFWVWVAWLIFGGCR